MQISIIIPMRNEERFVSRCLDSILAQLGDRDNVEILCVDGASTDRTAEIVREYAARDARVHLLHNPRRIVPTAMNLALDQARGAYIMRLDCHAEYDPDYVTSTLTALQRTGADIIGGVMTTLPAQDTPTGRAIAAASSSRFGVGASAFRTGGGEQEVDALPFGTFRREVFERWGRFDERLVRNQDIELYSRVRTGGGRVMLSPSIHLTYYTRATFAGLREQAFGNGLWNPYTIHLTGGGLRLRHFVPLGFVVSLVVLALGGWLWRPLWSLLAGEIVAYALAAGYAAVIVARSAQVAAPRVFLAFLQLHLAYGAGSLWGVLTAPLKFGWRPKRTSRIGQPPSRP